MKVDFEDLHQTLLRVQGTIAGDAHVEVYTFLAFRDGKITSFNGVVGTITASGLEALGDFCVPGRKFCSIVSAVRKQKGEITFADDWLFIKADNFKTKLPVYNPEEFPDIAPLNLTRKICEATNVHAALGAASVFVEKDGEKGQITGIGFSKGKVYSTDGKRIVQADLSVPVENPFTISRQAAEQIISLGQPDYLFKCASNLGALYAETKTVMIARSPATQFPFAFVERVFEQKGSDLFEVPEGLRKCVDRVRSFAEDDEGVLILRADGVYLKLSTASTETGEASDAIGLTSSPFQVKLKGSKFATLLSRLKPTQADVTDLTQGDGRMVIFSGEGFDCAFAAMV